MTPYYDDGQCVIYHGDCRDVLPTLPDVGDIVTDPPYDLGDKLHAGPKWNKHFGSGAPDWDKDVTEIVFDFPALASSCIIWGGQFFALPPSRGWLVWDKIVRQFSSGHCELAWTNLNQPVRAFNFSHAELQHEGKVHPTQKPLKLMSWCLGFLPQTEVVTDPFMGSGTTLRAAKDRGMRAVGIELSERYCEIAATRLAQGVLDFGGAA